MTIRFRQQSEDSIQQHVCRLLESFGRKDISWFAVPNGEQRSRMTGARLKAQGVRAGAPDMVLLIDGKFHGLELKTARGRPSPAQINFGNEIINAGGRYHLVYGLDAAADCLSVIGALRQGITIVGKGKR